MRTFAGHFQRYHINTTRNHRDPIYTKGNIYLDVGTDKWDRYMPRGTRNIAYIYIYTYINVTVEIRINGSGDKSFAYIDIHIYVYLCYIYIYRHRSVSLYYIYNAWSIEIKLRCDKSFDANLVGHLAVFKSRPSQSELHVYVFTFGIRDQSAYPAESSPPPLPQAPTLSPPLFLAKAPLPLNSPADL